ncbi:MAG TPA: VOC family protein [Gemmatimonadales bacterium]|nr:VOC family protein [Gemmatimonadales bacterium]
MPLIDSYAPGMFCWADLGTPDAISATRFYTSLFGWTADNRPMGPDGFYTMLNADGRSVAALYQQDPAQQSPPHWLSYISVASVNETAELAKSLGAAVLMEPFDVLDVGRMAMVQDPAGAVVALWEARRHAGAGIVGETSSICWNELATTDTDRAGTFYTGLLGWEAETRPLHATTYTRFTMGGVPRGGMLALRSSAGAVPPHWLVYFAVSDCDGATALAQSLGGTVRVPPADAAGVGRFSVLADPQGGVFAAIELRAT